MAQKKTSRWEKIKKRFYDIIQKQIKQDKPQKVALGCSLGVGINFFPTMGFGFVFAYLLAVLFRVNRTSATGTSIITGPVIPFMYALNLVIGGLILSPIAGSENIGEFIIDQYTTILQLGNLQDRISSALEFFGSTFMVGALVNASVFGFAFYLLVSNKLKNM
ncbi:DUF2062 domain-containing protein [Dethiobacter alkaliphilus]|uniref:DUF2062 domain-containing protein n=1 Tax=Dethiobacter alkaliphilus AHT 1 TaxID=555088 RepID=C0GCE1_DETAL|nr:DUF2062 domain-containing protein [Dethiobacter alkaliphilus]EEG78876.1 hypothetical protein DealDRAFT_0150 [Dethiobacter alkaliphilus AHT 1]